MYSKINVLLAEDSEDDAFLLKRAFSRQGVNAPFQVVTDGAAAIAYLAGREPYEDRQKHPLPQLILLDIKMPGTDGFEVLKWLRAEAPLQLVPVVVLTSSTHQDDIDKSHALGANAYTDKPIDIESQQALVQSIQKFWLDQHRYPSFGSRSRLEALNSSVAQPPV